MHVCVCVCTNPTAASLYDLPNAAEVKSAMARPDSHALCTQKRRRLGCGILCVLFQQG